MDDQRLGFAAFREQIKASRESFPHHWEASRKLMVPETLQTMLPALIHHIQEVTLDPILRERLICSATIFSTNWQQGGEPGLKRTHGVSPFKSGSRAYGVGNLSRR